MAEEKISTESVAAEVMEAGPIVLRQTDHVRLVFQTMIVDKAEAPVKGYFVYQRKLKADDWEEVTGEKLSSLKAGEGYALELHSDEVAKLLEGIQARKELYEEHGIQFGERDYFAGHELPEVIRKVLAEPESELADAFRALDPDRLLSLGRTVDVSKLDALLAEWDENKDNADEDFWQDLLNRNAWVFSHLTGSPVVVLEERAYVGGKDISNRGGGMVDYLVKNALTSNVTLVEIKTPVSDLCGSEYRGGTYLPGTDVAGGIVQVLGYRNSFLASLHALKAESEDEMHAYNPRCFLLVGQIERLPDENAMKSFELFRNGQANVVILTFDEARARLQGIRDVLTEEEGDAPAEVTEAAVERATGDGEERGRMGGAAIEDAAGPPWEGEGS